MTSSQDSSIRTYLSGVLRASLASLIVALLAWPTPLQAQAALVSASPGSDEVLRSAPGEVRLVFNLPLLDAGSSIQVRDESGQPADNHDSRVDPTNRFALVVGLPTLFEGRYSVRYVAAPLGSSTLLTETYTFTIDLPEPVLTLRSPANGQSFPVGPVPIRLDSRFIDFTRYNTRVRVYVDGTLHNEMQALRTRVEGLQPGVHEIRTVLVQLENREIPETLTTVTIAIRQPGARQGAAFRAASTDPGINLSVTNVLGLMAITSLLFGSGVWLGRQSE